MTKNIIIPLVLMCLMSFPSWGVTYDDLVERDGLYYKKFTDVPFTGEVEGKWKGSIKNGKREGTWVYYWGNGQLWKKGDYKNGKREGTWVYYYRDGSKNTRSGVYRNDKKVSD